MTESLILRTTTRGLMALLLLFSLFLLLRGHDEPGGGFVGGLVAGAAFALLALAEGTASARDTLSLDPRWLIAGGLLVMLASAFAGSLTGAAFFTGVWASVDVPMAGAIHVGSPLAFDLGIYLAVWGVTTTVLFAMGEV